MNVDASRGGTYRRRCRRLRRRRLWHFLGRWLFCQRLIPNIIEQCRHINGIGVATKELMGASSTRTRLCGHADLSTLSKSEGHTFLWRILKATHRIDIHLDEKRYFASTLRRKCRRINQYKKPDVNAGIEYWNTQPASLDGVLGQFFPRRINFTTETYALDTGGFGSGVC